MKVFNNKPVYITINGYDHFSRLICGVANFLFLNVAFFMMNYLKRSTFELSVDYVRLLFLFYLICFCISLFTKKFHVENLSVKSILWIQAKSVVFMAYSISFLVVFFGLTSFSRMHIFGTCLIFFILETSLCSLIYLGKKKEMLFRYNKADDAVLQRSNISIFLIISDFILLSAAFFAVNLFKRGTFALSPNYEKLLLLIYALWLIAIIITKKLNIQNFQNYYFALAAGIKSIVFMALTLSMIIFAFRQFYFSRFQIFGTLLLYSLLGAVLNYFYFIMKFGGDLTGDVESADDLHEYIDQRDLSLEGIQNKLDLDVPSSFMKILSERYLKSFRGIFEFVNKAIDLSNICDSRTTIINSSDLHCVQILEENSVRLLINLTKINDVRWINRYFLEIYKSLEAGGYFVGRADSIEIHRKRFFKQYPKYFAKVFYVLHFIFFRVFAKLPKLRKIYFALTKGKNRMISRAEVLGRLSFCGFKILSEKEIDGRLYFVVQKAKTPSLDQNPSYGPLIKLRRYGLNGQMIDVHKFRTMYPYSEYLQEYIYEHHKLNEAGKIRKDFRVTDWGRFMRKYWIDELPMLYNWIKGDMKLFGVRPLSKHYLNLYDIYLQKIRRKVKPGLIPPYYADMPRELEEINKSEIRYIQAYLEHPFKTQIIYFGRALNNILLKGARSG